MRSLPIGRLGLSVLVALGGLAIGFLAGLAIEPGDRSTANGVNALDSVPAGPALPCDADLSLILDGGIAAEYSIGAGPNHVYVLTVVDDSSALDLQKLVFDSCGGMDNVTDLPLGGDLSWQRLGSGGMTEFGTLALKEAPPTAVALTVQIDCSDDGCSDTNAIHRALSAAAYLWESSMDDGGASEDN